MVELTRGDQHHMVVLLKTTMMKLIEDDWHQARIFRVHSANWHGWELLQVLMDTFLCPQGNWCNAYHIFKRTISRRSLNKQNIVMRTKIYASIKVIARTFDANTLPIGLCLRGYLWGGASNLVSAGVECECVLHIYCCLHHWTTFIDGRLHLLCAAPCWLDTLCSTAAIRECISMKRKVPKQDDFFIAETIMEQLQGY